MCRQHPLSRIDGVNLLLTDSPKAPFAFLNYILWNKALSLQDETGRLIFRHELAHLKQGHTWDKLACQVLTCIFWINPFYWLIQKELNIVHEFIADEQAVADRDTGAFARMLLQSYSNGSYLRPEHHFFSSLLKRRLAMLQERPASPQAAAIRRLAAIPLLACVVLLFSFSTRTAAAHENNPSLSTPAHKGQPSKVLDAEMVALHLTPYNNPSATLGSFVDDHDGVKYFQHSAGNDGFCGFYYASLEDGYGLVVFLNSEDGRLMPEIMQSVAKAYSWKKIYQEPKRKTTDKMVAVPDSVLKSYQGIYVYEGQWAAVESSGKGYRYFTNGTSAKMYFTTPARFYNEEFAAVKEFYRDDRGAIAGYTRNIDGKDFPKAIKITGTDTLHLERGALADISWHLLEQKKYGASIEYLRRGVQLYPEDLNMAMNLAHAYLLNKNYTSAMAIHKAHVGDNVSPGVSWVDQLRNDLIYFREHHYNVQPFDRVFAALGISKPKGY